MQTRFLNRDLCSSLKLSRRELVRVRLEHNRSETNQNCRMMTQKGASQKSERSHRNGLFSRYTGNVPMGTRHSHRIDTLERSVQKADRSGRRSSQTRECSDGPLAFQWERSNKPQTFPTFETLPKVHQRNCITMSHYILIQSFKPSCKHNSQKKCLCWAVEFRQQHLRQWSSPRRRCRPGTF